MGHADDANSLDGRRGNAAGVKYLACRRTKGSVPVFRVLFNPTGMRIVGRILLPGFGNYPVVLIQEHSLAAT